MNLIKERRAIEQALDNYRQELDVIAEDAFTLTPSAGGWSYAEVYDHIMKASLGSAIALERCTNNNCPPTTKGLNFWGHYVMLTGNFPPGKVQVPGSVAVKMAPAKIDKEQARNLIIKVRKKVEQVAVLLPDAKGNARWQHPRLGMLNARQWFKFIRIHLQHHLKQLERIKKQLQPE